MLFLSRKNAGFYDGVIDYLNPNHTWTSINQSINLLLKHNKLQA